MSSFLVHGLRISKSCHKKHVFCLKFSREYQNLTALRAERHQNLTIFTVTIKMTKNCPISDWIWENLWCHSGFLSRIISISYNIKFFLFPTTWYYAVLTVQILEVKKWHCGTLWLCKLRLRFNIYLRVKILHACKFLNLHALKLKVSAYFYFLII